MSRSLLPVALAAMLTALVLPGSLAAADAKPTLPPTVETASDAADRTAIEKSAAAFCEAFNRGDARAVAALWTPDGDYVDESGERFVGRQSIEKQYAKFFAAHSGTKIRTLIDSIKIVNGDTAIEDGRAYLDPAPPGPPGTSRYMAVHTRIDGKWLLSTVRDSRVETPSTYGKLQEMEWLIGSWTAEERGLSLVMNFRWVANKSFIERTYSVTNSGEVVSSGIQIIGWDPLAAAPRSWTFTSEGGYASGTWTPREGAWAIATSSVSPDGTTSRAVNIVTRIDNNAITWRSVQRSAGDRRLPDEPEVLVRRGSKP